MIKDQLIKSHFNSDITHKQMIHLDYEQNEELFNKALTQLNKAKHEDLDLKKSKDIIKDFQKISLSHNLPTISFNKYKN